MRPSSTAPFLPAVDNALKLLLVEDHAAVRMAVEGLLGMAFPHCHLLSANCAETALPLCQTHAPQVVIMDVALPGMSGIEATRQIRARHPDMQVVMHSHSDMPVFRDEAMAAGACAFVLKGRTSRDLVVIISGLLGIASEAASR